MSDVGGEFAENCGFEGRILCEVLQPCDTPATEYTPPDGYRVLQIGEVVQKDDIFLAVNGEHWPAKRIGETVNNNRYLRRTEVEQAAALEPCAPCDSRDTCDTPATEYTPPEGWRLLLVGEPLRQGDLWITPSGSWVPLVNVGAERVQPIQTGGGHYIRRIEPQPEPEPEPQPEPEHLQAIISAQAETIARLQSEAHELNMEIGGLQGDLSRRQARIRDLETMHAEAAQAVVRADKANDKLRAQADDFRSEIHYVQKELGEARAELAGAIQSRDAFAAVNREQADKLEALQAAAAELQKRHPDHVGRAISTEEWMDQFARDASVSRLQADRNDLAGKVISLREQLQLANDKLAQLETLQPIAAACHTAQTMVRDMLGHMRCLLALHHTTDRRNFCTLLESILEVFDEAECDEDEDDTSEAGQG